MPLLSLRQGNKSTQNRRGAKWRLSWPNIDVALRSSVALFHWLIASRSAFSGLVRNVDTASKSVVSDSSIIGWRQLLSPRRWSCPPRSTNVPCQREDVLLLK